MIGCHTSFAGVPPSPDGLHVYPFRCPSCEGEGRWDDYDRCHLCLGSGAVTAQQMRDWADGDPTCAPVRVPTPAAVRKGQCGECAFRQGAPEEDEPPPLDRPFYCHATMPVVDGEYAPVAWYKGMPLGALVCAGWWRAVTEQPLDPAPYVPAGDGWGERAT
ncbi:hypothetical protein [Planotetraspora sp. GP83]|uniref:hypothetical protein n=1 Tax=Planotetraspora sp. GP83 TaxID=3156264 RepID=UPI003512E6A6